MPSSSADSGENADAIFNEHVLTLRERVVLNVVENYVVTLIALGKIFLRVIDHPISADRFHKIDIACAADASHVCTKRFRNLYGEGAHAPGRAVDQHLLSRLNVSHVAQTLQRRQAGHTDRTGLLKR